MKRKFTVTDQITVVFEEPRRTEYFNYVFRMQKTPEIRYFVTLYCEAPTNKREQGVFNAFVKMIILGQPQKITFLNEKLGIPLDGIEGPRSETTKLARVGLGQINSGYCRAYAEYELPAFPKFIPDAIILSLPNSLKIKLNNGIQCRREKNKSTT